MFNVSVRGILVRSDFVMKNEASNSKTYLVREKKLCTLIVQSLVAKHLSSWSQNVAKL